MDAVWKPAPGDEVEDALVLAWVPVVEPCGVVCEPVAEAVPFAEPVADAVPLAVPEVLLPQSVD